MNCINKLTHMACTDVKLPSDAGIVPVRLLVNRFLQVRAQPFTHKQHVRMYTYGLLGDCV